MAGKSKRKPHASTGPQPLPILASVLRTTMDELVMAGVQVDVAAPPGLLAFRIRGWGKCPNAACGAFAPAQWITDSGCPECQPILAGEPG